MSGRGKPVTGPDGTAYRSKAAAARAIGVHPCTITCHMRQFGNLENLGLHRTPVTKGHRTWPSIKAAARSLKCAPSLIQWHLRRHGHLDHIGKWGGRRYSKPLRIGPVEWPARVDALRDLGITKPTLAKWLSPKASPRQREELIARVMAVQVRREDEARMARSGDVLTAEGLLGEITYAGSRKAGVAGSAKKTGVCAA